MYVFYMQYHAHAFTVLSSYIAPTQLNFSIALYLRDLENYDECRKVFQMGINSASDDPEAVCEAMLQFERERGTLETFEAALEKCGAQLKRVKERRQIVSLGDVEVSSGAPLVRLCVVLLQYT